MAKLQTHCAFCGNKAKNTGGWRYAPIFCSGKCELEYDRIAKEKELKNPNYSRDRKLSWVFSILFILFPFIVLFYAIFFA